MGEEISTLVWGYGFEELSDGVLDLLEVAGVCLSQECLELGECLLDGAQVGTVGRQIDSLALAARIARCMAGSLWLLRLSITTMSPGHRVGTRNCTTQARKTECGLFAVALMSG
jgi:hypothetical protein